MEDALCLVFLETQFDDTTAKTGDEKDDRHPAEDVGAKMTPKARESRSACSFPRWSRERLNTGIADPINAKILAIAEDQLQGFQRDPLGEIPRQSGVELPVVIDYSLTSNDCERNRLKEAAAWRRGKNRNSEVLDIPGVAHRSLVLPTAR